MRPLVLRSPVREAAQSMSEARFLGYRTTNCLHEAHRNSVTPACVRGILLQDYIICVVEMTLTASLLLSVNHEPILQQNKSHAESCCLKGAARHSGERRQSLTSCRQALMLQVSSRGGCTSDRMLDLIDPFRLGQKYVPNLSRSKQHIWNCSWSTMDISTD